MMISILATILSLVYHHANGFCFSSLPSYNLFQKWNARQNLHNVVSTLFLHPNNVIMESDEDLFRSIIQEASGVPRATLEPEDIPPLLMKALQNNDYPETDTGLKSA
mmetsp:Transcript_32128/g.47459  ORF Transcript_32128/g.47459 Transcript_32128/m.47459 type:complete len:107 (-) Transcript_32128:2682-3002(-)